MTVDNRLSDDISAAGRNPHFDRCARNLIANPQILSRILSECVPEYKDLAPEEIEQRFLLDTSIGIASTPLFRDVMRPGEEASITEGTVVYDILAHLKAPSGDGEIGVYVNIEVQNDMYPGYSLKDRAVYYWSRIMSAEYGKVFTRSDYSSIESVYSLWVCTAPPKLLGNTVHSFSAFTPDAEIDDRLRRYYNRDSYGSIVFVNIGDELNRDNITGLLWTLVGSNLEIADRKRILGERYGLTLKEELEGEISEMCNASIGFYRNAKQDGIVEGRAEGREEKSLEMVASAMRKGGMSAEEAMDLLSVPETERAGLLVKLCLN